MGKKHLTSLITLFLIFTQVSAQTSILPYKYVWKYLDDGANQVDAWSGKLYDDSNWKTGQAEFGYGDGGESTVISFGPDSNYNNFTTYFRETISIPNSALYTEFTASLLRDDGAVMAVNGLRIHPSNLPTVTLTYITKATKCTDDGETAQAFKIVPSAFINGDNIIAVETHQDGRATSDKSFDMKLECTVNSNDQTSPALLNIERYPPTTITTSSSVVFRCTFSEGVTGVDAADFNVTTYSGFVSGVINSHSVNAVSSTGTTYDVTVDSVTGEGDICLDLKSAGIDIKDYAGNSVSGGFTSGETYSILAGV